MSDKLFTAKWQKEINSFKGIKSTFIIEGNINDVYPIYAENNSIVEVNQFGSLNRVLHNDYETGITKDHYDYLFCDPIFGFSDSLNLNNVEALVKKFEKLNSNKENEIRILNGKQAKSDQNSMVHYSEIIRSAMTMIDQDEPAEERKSIMTIVNLTSRFITSHDNLSDDETQFFTNIFYASANALRVSKHINTMVLIVDKFNDVPTWFYLNNPHIRTITIPNPDRGAREAYIKKFFSLFKENSETTNKAMDKFVNLTEGMKILELNELRRLNKRNEIKLEDIGDLVSLYKYGVREDRWLQIRENIGHDFQERIEQNVIGQEQAISRIVQVVKRAVTGLSGMQHSSSNSKPRGIMFLVGPTGTGKTETVKSISRLLFEDEKAIIRFDMSEYSAEHSDQKLFGAPPGYVGYDSGGQLTNAVKNNPFSILLFDEIEKAHQNIMDKFLQVLEDGRMTDGQGNTVYFSETLIFFTSNAGISRMERNPATGEEKRVFLVTPSNTYDEIKEKVEEVVTTVFRPEVLNRIGENIIVFNFINEQASKLIVSLKIKKINANIAKQNKIEIVITEDLLSHFYDLAWQEKPRSNGGRGIGNVIEEFYINPLAEYIFDNNIIENSKIEIKIDDSRVIFEKV